MSFKQYTMPRLHRESGKWVFEILDSEERLLERVEHDTEQAALADHRERFIDDVLNDSVMKEVRR